MTWTRLLHAECNDGMHCRNDDSRFVVRVLGLLVSQDDELHTCIKDRIHDELQAVLVTEIDYWLPELHSRTAVAAVGVVAWKLQKLTLQKKNKKPQRRRSAKKQ